MSEEKTTLPNLAVFSNEAHHTYGMELGENLKRVRQNVDWNPTSKIVDIQLDDTKIHLQIGSRSASVNDKIVTLNVVPQIINSYTYVPLRFISEAFGANVDWNSDTKTIIIIYANGGD